MDVPEFCVRLMRFVQLTPALTADELDKVSEIASSMMNLPPPVVETVTPDQVRLDPGGTLKLMSAASFVLETVPEPSENVPPALIVMLPLIDVDELAATESVPAAE
jgi:hypothetical protein